jgi:hypothetical protein
MAYQYCHRDVASLLLARLADARIGDVFMLPYGNLLEEDERPEGWVADGEALRQEWHWSAHRDRKWERRRAFAHFLVGCTFMSLPANVPPPLSHYASLPPEAVATDDDRKALRRNRVFREKGIVENVASFM